MSDSKYFTTTKKGEIYELKADLQNEKPGKRKDAVKKVIASMTVGKDVSALFPDVVNCMQTGNLELKKLVYLYLMNYAKSQPEMAILAVNTFVKDCSDPNPLIRALAVRTMGCIRVDRITEYLCEPLRRCLRDDDPYVRKTAAVCVAKLHDINPELVEDQGFLDSLREHLSDSNPMVIANAIASLTEISDNSESAANRFEINSGTLNKLLTALNECTEWGQVFILDSLASYVPSDGREAEGICERVTPRLQHANAAVVLSAVKILMKYMELIDSPDALASLTKKLAPPLVTLLSSEPEVQYVALRNINLIVQKRPEILKNEMKVFFVKYNDPIYVKIEKLDVMIRLAAEHNITQVLAELKEYATEVDVDFVRKSVRAIGRCAIKIEPAAKRCVDALLELIQTKVNYVVQEAIVVIKDIFRKYPNQYESIIATLCENLDTLDEPEAKASMVWIIGEYADRIENADELLEQFLDTYHDENTQVQLQLLTGVVKLFLKRPARSQDLVQKVLTYATQNSDNPDLRDRGYIYWRLLSTDPAAAKAVVLSEKPLINDEMDMLDEPLLNELICNISTLASVYHKPPSTFVEGRTAAMRTLPSRAAPGGAAPASGAPAAAAAAATAAAAAAAAPAAAPQQDSLIGDLLDMDIGGGGMGGNAGFLAAQQQGDLSGFLGGGAMGGMQQQHQQQAPANGGGGVMDLLGGGMGGGMPAQAAAAPAPAQGGANDLLGLGGMGGLGLGGGGPTYTPAAQVWLSAQKGKGLEISGTFSRRQNQIYMDMTFTNRAMQPMSGFAIQLNKNSFGLSPATPLQVQTPLAPNASCQTSLPLGTTGQVQRADPLNNLQVAIKNSIDVFYFATPVPAFVFWVESGAMERSSYLQTWKTIPESNESKSTVACNKTAQQINDRLASVNVFTVAQRSVEGHELLYASLKYTNNIAVLAEVTVTGAGSVNIALKSMTVGVLPLTHAELSSILADSSFA